MIRAAPPEIPKNAIRVLRRPPVVIEHESPPPTKPRTSVAREPPPTPPPQAKKPAPPPPIILETAPPPVPPLPRPATKAVAPPPVLPKEPPAEAPPRTAAPPRDERPRGLTRTGLFGIAVATLAFAGLIFNFLLPWISYDASAGPSPIPGLPDGRLGHGDLGNVADVAPYVQALVTAPPLLCILMLLAGATLATVDELPRITRRFHRLTQIGVLLLLVVFGFFQTLYGGRWLGLYASTLLDAGDSGFHIHIVPYLNLATGAFVLVGAFLLLRPRWRAATETVPASRIPFDDAELPLWTVATIAIAILLLPLLPVATVDPGDAAQTAGEGELAIDPRPQLKDAGRDFGLARALLWGGLWLNVGCLAVVLLERVARLEALHSAFVFAYGLNGLVGVFGIVFALILAFDVYDPPRVVPSINFVPAGAFLALAFLWSLFYRQTLRPFLQVARSRPL